MKKIILATVIAMSLSAGANASVLNPSDYFNAKFSDGITAQSSDNLWQLGYLSAGEFTLFDYKDSVPTTEDHVNHFSSFDFYKNSTYYGFGINTTGGDVSVFNGTVSDKAIYAHPGDFEGGDIVLRFYAQSSANYAFDTSFDILHYGAAGLDISLNNNSGTTSLFNDSYSFGSGTSYQDTVFLSATDSVDFTIERFDGTWAGDSTAIVANVTEVSSVPLPASLGLFGLAMAGLAFGRIKNK